MLFFIQQDSAAVTSFSLTQPLALLFWTSKCTQVSKVTGQRFSFHLYSFADLESSRTIRAR